MNKRHMQPPYKLGLQLLKDNPTGISAKDLSDNLGIAKRNVLEYIKLWREENLVRIIKWERRDRPGGMIPLYALKTFPNQKDRNKPPALTGPEKQARYRSKHGPLICARRRLARTGDAKHLKTLFDPIIRSNQKGAVK